MRNMENMKYINMKSQTQEVRAYVKGRVVALNQDGFSTRDIANTLNISEDYVRHILEIYRNNNNSLPQEKTRGRKVGEHRRLSAEIGEEIKKHITEKTPDQFGLKASLWSRNVVQEFIQKQYGIYIPIRTISTYLQRWGMTCQRPYNKSYSQNPNAVKEFQEEIFPEIAKRAKQENALILFGDETGINNQEYYQRGFSPRGKTPFIRLPSKREKINMISVIEFNGHCEFMCYESTMTQQLLIEFMERLLLTFNRKIFLVLDNLKVHHGKMVKSWEEEHKQHIEIFYFPSYSPDYNPDEYLNHGLKQEIHSGKIPRTQKDIAVKTTNYMLDLETNPEKVGAFFRYEKLAYIYDCLIA